MRATAASSSSTGTCRTARSGSRRGRGGFHFAAARRRAGATRGRATSSAARCATLLRAQARIDDRAAAARPRRLRVDGGELDARQASSSAVHSSSARRAVAMAGKERLDQRPEPRRMIELDQVRDLVRDDVVRELGRQLDQPPVEPDLALAGCSFPIRCARSTAGPAAARRRGALRIRRRAGASARSASSRSQRPTNAATCALVAAAPDGARVRWKRSARCPAARAGCTVERELAAAVEDRRAGLPFARQHVAPARAPLGAARAGSSRARARQRGLDLADRHPARRAHGEAGEVDLHADRAPARADQPVVDALAGERDAARSHVVAARRRAAAEGVPSRSRAISVARRHAEARDLALDPASRLRRERLRVLAGRRDRRAERDRHRARPLAEDALRPQLAGIVRDRDDRHAELDGEPRAAGLVLGARAGADPRAFRVDRRSRSPAGSARGPAWRSAASRRCRPCGRW